MRNELKQVWYDDYPRYSVVDILELIRRKQWSKEDLFAQILELYKDGQISLDLNSTPYTYPIMRSVDDKPEWFEMILNRTHKWKHVNSLICYAYRHGVKKQELKDLFWIMSQLKRVTNGRVRMTWSYLSRHKRFFKVD